MYIAPLVGLELLRLTTWGIRRYIVAWPKRKRVLDRGIFVRITDTDRRLVESAIKLSGETPSMFYRTAFRLRAIQIHANAKRFEAEFEEQEAAAAAGEGAPEE